MGLKCLTLLNRYFLLKKCWEVYSSSSNGCKFLHVRFIRNGMPRSSYAISSIWLGLKKFWPQVLLHGRWLIGSGSQISFWRDNFVGVALKNLFGVYEGRLEQLEGFVNDYIHDRQWVLPSLLQLHFPVLNNIISNTPVSINPQEKDRLIWSASSSGTLTAKEAFHFMRPPLTSVDWGNLVWCKHVAPRMSILVWKVFKGRVLTEHFLQRRGVSLCSINLPLMSSTDGVHGSYFSSLHVYEVYLVSYAG